MYRYDRYRRAASDAQRPPPLGLNRDNASQLQAGEGTIHHSCITHISASPAEPYLACTGIPSLPFASKGACLRCRPPHTDIVPIPDGTPYSELATWMDPCVLRCKLQAPSVCHDAWCSELITWAYICSWPDRPPSKARPGPLRMYV